LSPAGGGSASRVILFQMGVDKKLNRIVAVQECDATGDDSSNEAGYIKTI